MLYQAIIRFVSHSKLSVALVACCLLISVVGPIGVQALPTTPSSVEWADAIDVAHQYANGQAAKDPSTIAATFASDGVYIDTGNTTQNSQRHGQVAIKQYFEQVFASYPDLQFTIDGVTAHHEPRTNTQIVSVSVAWTFDGTHSKTTNIAGKATGHRVIVHGDDLLEIEVSGPTTRIIRVYSYYPADEFVRQDVGSGD